MSEPHLYMRFGDNKPVQILVFEPLFEEANRTRRLLSCVARALNTHDIGVNFCALPGTGESLTDIADVRLSDWRAAAAAAIATIKPVVIASVRGGALIDDAGTATGWWRLAPDTGARIVRDLRRTQLSGETGLYAGHRLSDAMLTDLEGASPVPLAPMRVARLENDAADADIKLIGSPLWRRAEPGEDAALAEAIATDLAAWTKLCAAS